MGVEGDVRRITATVLVTGVAALFYGLLAAAIWILLREVVVGLGSLLLLR